MVATGLGVSERTVWRWVAAAAATGVPDRKRFVITDEVRQRLAYWRGNVVAVHRELVDAAAAGGPAAPATLGLERIAWPTPLGRRAAPGC